MLTSIVIETNTVEFCQQIKTASYIRAQHIWHILLTLMFCPSFSLAIYIYILKVRAVSFLLPTNCHKCGSFQGECLWRSKCVIIQSHHAESRSPSDPEAQKRYLRGSPTRQNEGLWHTSPLVQKRAVSAVKSYSRISTSPDQPNYHVLKSITSQKNNRLLCILIIPPL